MKLVKGEKPLKCASCESEYVHFQKVAVLTGADDYECNQRIEIDNSFDITHEKGSLGKTPNRTRELSVYMEFTCEMCPQTTYFYMADHKGMVFGEKYL